MLRIAILMMLTGSAVAAPGRRLEVEVDQTVEVEVGNLIGVICDQPKLIDAAMKTKKTGQVEVNVFVVKGVTVGTTQCRIGNDAMGGSRLFDVTVIEKKKPTR